MLHAVDLEARGLCIELRKLLVAEGDLDDATTPKPHVDAKELVELVGELGMKLPASPPELKRQGVVE
jgi:hypothetical protein